MSRTRQPDIDPSTLDDPDRPVLGVAFDRPAGFHYPSHEHLRAQIVYAADGVLQVRTASATWIVPPQQAVWIPSHVGHATSNKGPAKIRTLYLHPDAVQDMPAECRVLKVSPLLREAIMHAVSIPPDYAPGSAQARFMAVIPDLLRDADPEPLHLPLPVDKRLRLVTDALMESPGDDRPLTDWARRVGASDRTIARHFQHETGLSFSNWRRRLRLLWAITRLSEGVAVTNVSDELGYANPSAFIAMFRRELGQSPRKYCESNNRA
ncbi:MAG: helix-turn-helix transcriptional regulator [Gammaproteobacteria bacterium]|nr:helix-turn-helix transcriptional regulator [Gammaproteobacteria bacterium]